MVAFSMAKRPKMEWQAIYRCASGSASWAALISKAIPRPTHKLDMRSEIVRCLAPEIEDLAGNQCIGNFEAIEPFVERAHDRADNLL